MNILLTLLLLLMPVKAENGRFNIYQNGQRIGFEDFSISPKGKGYLAEGRTQIFGTPTFDLRSRMELDEALKPTFYEFQSKGNIIRLKVANPVSELELTVDGKTELHDVRFPSDGAIIDNNFFHHYLILLYRQNISGQTIPAFVPQQQMALGALSVRNVGNRTYELETMDGKVVATTDADGRLIRLTAPGANVVVER